MAASRLSVAIITRNEAENLEACLRTVAWADEIIVVDSGSTDGTLEIARRFTNKIFVESDWQGFGVQRQRAQEKATGDWILAIDADERVTPELKEEILKALKKDDRSKVFALPRLNWAFGSFIRHSGWYPDRVVRLYPREKAAYGPDLVHEKVVVPPSMEVVCLKGHLLHFTFRDLEHWVCKTARYAGQWAEGRQRQGKRGAFLQGITHAIGYFLRTYFFKRGFLDGRAGLLLALLGAYSRLLKYADLWLRQQPMEPMKSERFQG
jgi:(heptosyl)LPS beta-1,4-glucosyltransferase